MPLVNLGMDSLSAVELANWSNERFGLPPGQLLSKRAVLKQSACMLPHAGSASLVRLATAERGLHAADGMSHVERS
jgi:hypothetical protein